MKNIGIWTSINGYKKYLFLGLCFSVNTFLQAQLPAFDSLLVQQRSTVYFDFGADDIQSDGDTTLNQIIAQTNRLKDYQIHIEAHTDSIGNPISNKALSIRRAETVKNWLLKHGLTDSLKIRTTPYGASNPYVDNTTEESRQLNRRATITLYNKAPMTLIKGKVVDHETGEGIKAMVIFHSKTNRDTLKSLPNGDFQLLVPQEIVLGVDVFAKGYFFETKMIKTGKENTPLLEIPLPKAKKGEVAALQRFYFVGNKAELLPVSEPQLPKVLKFMQVNSDTKIEIAGHINHPNQPPVNKDSWHFDLSVRRAKLVYDYLVNNGIDSTLVQFAGYGNFEMKYPNATNEKQMALNRRVEIRVLE